MEREDRWATAVRILAVLSLVLAVLAILEGVTVRQARAELQLLRTEREQMKDGVVAAWARQSGEEFGEALRRLDSFIADPDEGPARPGGLCADGRLNRDAIVRFGAGAYLSARAAGRSYDAAIAEMKAAVDKRAP